MPVSQFFFDNLARYGEAPAAIEGELQVSYQQLQVRCAEFSQQLNQINKQTNSPQKQLIFLKAHNNIATLVAYLTTLQNRHAVLLLDPDIDQSKLDKLIASYQPNLLIDSQTIEQCHSKPLVLESKLALLLSTSGSTGSAKQVCLSADNVQANALSIVEYLPLLASDKTITTLPFYYSYGLSVLNSHLLVGACIVFNQHSLVSREFWQLFKQHNINSFAGVPQSYEMLLRLRFERMDLPSLRYFTQAGGKLAADKIQPLARYANANDKQFFVMYGQTEATARMAYLKSELCETKPHAIGQAIPGGQFSLHDEHGELITQPEESGELIYRGTNIMLGYANCLSDLTEFTPLNELATGDIAYRDSEGDYVICGRIKRFIKLFGLRINLDEVETLLANKGLECYCLGDDTKLLVALTNDVVAQQHIDINELKMWLSRELQINHNVINIKPVAQLPLTNNGKKDYPAVLTMLDD